MQAKDIKKAIVTWRADTFRSLRANHVEQILCGCFFAWLTLAAMAAAQERLPMIPADKQTEAQKKAVAGMQGGSFGVGGPFNRTAARAQAGGTGGCDGHLLS